jgi:hypothetical protein
VANPGYNRSLVFDPVAATMGGGLMGDDLAARYMAWMALGGTAKHLPQDVLGQVAETPVLGELRSTQHLSVGVGTPDMLLIGLTLCEQLVSYDVLGTKLDWSGLVSTGRYDWSAVSGLVTVNGDAEMWLKLCNLNNRPIVRVPVVPGGSWKADTRLDSLTTDATTLYWATSKKGADGKVEDWYGPNPVWDHRANVRMGVTADNYVPLCISKPTDTTQQKYAEDAIAAAKVNGQAVPFCPDGFVTPDHQVQISDSGDRFEARKWAARGAINAALAVFLYLDDIERHPENRLPLYNECSLLGKN